jgi:hypothetical protein
MVHSAPPITEADVAVRVVIFLRRFRDHDFRREQEPCAKARGLDGGNLADAADVVHHERREGFLVYYLLTIERLDWGSLAASCMSMPCVIAARFER